MITSTESNKSQYFHLYKLSYKSFAWASISMSSTFPPDSRSLVLMTFLPLSLLTRQQKNANRIQAFANISTTIKSEHEYKYVKYSRQNLIFMTPQHQVKFFYVFDVLYFMTHYLISIYHEYAMSSFHICPPKYCGKTGRKTIKHTILLQIQIHSFQEKRQA